MNSSCVWARRTASVLAMVLVVAAAMVMSAAGAEAGHCRDGGVWADTGMGIVGVKHTSGGATTQGVEVCAEPPHQGVGVNLNAGTSVAPDFRSAGVLLSAGLCTTNLGCTQLLNPTGATASVPSASADEPLDGDNVVGASVNTGSGVCPLVNGAPTGCQLGGSSGTYFSGGDPAPFPPVHPAVDPFLAYTHYTAFYGITDYALWCAGLPLYYGIDGIAILCALGAYQQFVVGPLDALL